MLSPRESRGRRGLVGYSLCGCKESDTTKQLIHTHVRNTVVNKVDISGIMGEVESGILRQFLFKHLQYRTIPFNIGTNRYI